MNTAELLQAHLAPAKRRYVRPYGTMLMPALPIVCRDGYSVSIQAGEEPYCEPRNNFGPWVEFELGFPNQADPLLEPYQEMAAEKHQTQSIFPYVPLVVVLTLLEKHGGIMGALQHIEASQPSEVNDGNAQGSGAGVDYPIR